ncbi:hypothetical protein LTR28_004408, partial [Elasticomyces elasticus]
VADKAKISREFFGRCERMYHLCVAALGLRLLRRTPSGRSSSSACSPRGPGLR